MHRKEDWAAKSKEQTRSKSIRQLRAQARPEQQGQATANPPHRDDEENEEDQEEEAVHVVHLRYNDGTARVQY